MHEAMLYEQLEGGQVQCQLCQRRCRITPGKTGYCKTRLNQDGTLYSLVYDQVSSVAVDPIEKKPLFHFYPTTQVLSLGTFGCNFRCIHCQNYTISHVEPGTERYHPRSRKLAPEETVELAKQYDCGGIAWTYNEPTVWFEYSLDTAKVAKHSGLYTCYITNGYLTAEALDTLGPYLDGYRVDVKGFTTEFYRKLASVTEWKGILDTAVRAKDKWGMHIEVITNIIPTMNDDDEQLRALARWIVKDLGELTPWHVTRFFPYLELSHLPPTPIKTLEKARETGLKEGLRFVYVGNVLGHDAESTYCYHCGKLTIQRVGYQTRMVGVQNGKCKSCGADLNIR